LLQDLVEAFPQADPSSEFYNDPIDGSEAVDFLSEFIPRAREAIDSSPPAVAVVLEGGLVQCVVSDNPERLPEMDLVVIDYDTDGAEEGITEVPQGEGRPPVKAFAPSIPITRAGIDIAAVNGQL
jgi:hypothetical protein